MNVATKKLSSFNELELKGYLISFIERAKDRAQLLLFVEAVQDIFEDETKDWWDELSPSQQADLEEGIAQTYDPTKLTPHEEVVKLSSQWIEE